MMSSLTATVSAGSRLEQKTPAEYLPYSTDMLLREYDAYSGKSGLQSRNRPISEKTESEKVRALPVHHKQPLGESFSLGRNKSKLQQIFPSASVDRNIRISSEIQVQRGTCNTKERGVHAFFPESSGSSKAKKSRCKFGAGNAGKQ